MDDFTANAVLELECLQLACAGMGPVTKLNNWTPKSYIKSDILNK